MGHHYSLKTLNGFFLFILFCILLHSPFRTAGQGIQRISQRGVELSYGFHHFITKSGVDIWQRYAPSSRGIALGYFMGNNLVKTRIRGFGFYESTRSARSDFSGYEAEALLNFYPLEFLRTRKHILDIYLFSGLNFSYLEFDDHTIGNRGKRTTLGHLLGWGAELILLHDGKVAYLFSEISAGDCFRLNTKSEETSSPIPEIITSVNVGIRYAF
jgi:hypothetical protein